MTITLSYMVVPKFQVYQTHAGKASKVIASAFLFQEHNSPYGPKQGDIDPSADNHIIFWINCKKKSICKSYTNSLSIKESVNSAQTVEDNK